MRPKPVTLLRVKLAPVYERSVYAIAIGLVLSGAAWLYFHYFGQIQGEFGPQTHPLEPWSLKIHGAFSALALVLIGSLLTMHVTPALQSKRHLLTGLTIFSVWLLLGVTGYLLYYVGDEDVRTIVSKLHWIVGLALPLILVVHVAERSWRRRQRA